MKSVAHFLTVWIWAEIYSTASETLGPEGCQTAWVHRNDYCYHVINARVHFDSAKAICDLKGSVLTSLWDQDEAEFVLKLLNELDVKERMAWIGAVPTWGVANKKWVWLDGSGSVELLKDFQSPEVTDELCVSLAEDTTILFLDCDVTLNAFICKKPVQKLYVPDGMNVTSEFMYLNKNPEQTIFERLRPPILEKINMETYGVHHLATVDVVHETDCAFKCYTIRECNAFVVTCKSSRKCNVRLCSLMAGFDVF